MKFKLFVSGLPESGKTYILKKISREFGLEGVVTEEIRAGCLREGFKAIDLRSGEARILAHVRGRGIKLGKYYVNPDVASWMARILEEMKDPLIIDEIGPMELLSKEFTKKIHKIIAERSFISSIHYKIAEKFSHLYRIPVFWIRERDDQRKLMEFLGRSLF